MKSGKLSKTSTRHSSVALFRLRSYFGAINSDDVSGPTDRLQRPPVARFLARLRQSVLPVTVLLAGTWAATAVESQPVVLKVLNSSAGPATATPQTGQYQNVLSAQGANRNEDGSTAPDTQGFGFLRLVSPKKQFYVGELVPVQLKAFFHAGVELRVDAPPRLNSDAFTMNKLSDQPDRSEQVIGGVPYTVFTWSTALAAVKAGDYEMSIELPTTVTVRQRTHRPRQRSGNPFGDPFFDEFFNDAFFDGFFGSATQKEIALRSEPAAVKILSVPTENRPPNFAGAVGRFELAAEAAPLQAAAGDLVMLKIKISGSGNFERANAPALEKNDQWKTYKPSAKFEPDDNSDCSGTKTFEQALVPLQSGKLAIPVLAFSYFDPESKHYVTRSTQPISVEASPGLNAAGTAASGADAHTVSAATPSGHPGMAASKLAPGRFHATLRPWFFNPWRAAGALLPSLGMVAAYWFIRRRQQLARDPHRARSAEAHRALQALLQDMESAAKHGATFEFFEAARIALQIQLGLLWGLLPRTITLAEVNARLNGEADGFRFVFELADEVNYTGRTFAAAELQQWYKVINAELKKLESSLSVHPRSPGGLPI